MYQYLQQLHSTVMKQENKIRHLEKAILQLNKEIQELKQKPAIHVDKMEYKFDQLKVETLEGTLNIGLNPADLQAIEDFSVKNGTQETSHDPKQVFHHSMEVEDELYRYLETYLPESMNQVAQRMNRNIDDRYLAFVKEDIKRQVPTRVQYYLQKNPPPNDPQKKEAWKQNILQLFQKEMENGIHTFLSNLPNNMKG
jgi:spore germination protein PC